jgi:tripartite-type tricarboxylate transporter receptor subunit TctC
MTRSAISSALCNRGRALRAAAWALLCLVLWLLTVATAAAQAGYPNRPIRVIVPFTPGTGIDILARAIGEKLSDRLKVGVVVDNRPGASGNIGTEAVSKAAPDGYTLLMTASTHVTNAALQASVPYDPARSFTPIGPTAIGNLALVVHPSVPATSVKELVALAKKEPGKLNYASPGSGTPHHLAMELFKLHFNVDLLHVPYKGTAGALTDLLGGQVQVMFLPVHVALVHVQSGKLRMLAAGGAHRSPVTPNVPSLADEGVTDIDVDIWYALLGPAALAPEQVALLNTEVNAILREPEVRENLSKQGLNPLPGTPQDLSRMIGTDLERWTRIVRAAKIKAD